MMRGHRFPRLTAMTYVFFASWLACCLASVSLAADKPGQPSIADAVIDSDRTRTPEGKLTIAVHVSLSPKWLNPQEIPAGMAYELLWKLHDNMIKANTQSLYSYALAEFYEMSPDLKTATVRLRPGLKFHNGDAVTSEDVKFSGSFIFQLTVSSTPLAVIEWRSYN